MASNKRIILFGKTGSGKSTIANALMTGSSSHVVFQSSSGFSGCTSKIQREHGRGWDIIDTVGLGESTAGTVSSANAEDMIFDFLLNVKTPYSHIAYVKSGSERFDILDEKVWRMFERVFAKAEDSFVVIITHQDEEWLNVEFNNLPGWVKSLSRDKILVTDIPPVSKDKEEEEEIKPIRQEAIKKLEDDLTALFVSRGSKYSTPEIANMNESELKHKAKAILRYITDLVSATANALADAFGIRNHMRIIEVLLSPFKGSSN